MAYTPTTSSSYAKNQFFGASIVKIELKDAGANSSDYFEIGRIKDASLQIQARSDTDSRNVTLQFGYGIEFSCMALGTGSDLMTLSSEISANDHDVKMTDINGHTYTFTYDQFQLSMGHQIEGQYENDKYMTINGGGTLTSAEFASMFATS